MHIVAIVLNIVNNFKEWKIVSWLKKETYFSSKIINASVIGL